MKNQAAIQKVLSIKSTIIVILVALLVGGIYTIFFDKDNPKNATANIESAETKSTGLNPNDSVKNIADVEKVIAKWVEKNPEAIIGSVVAMQQRAAEKQQQDAKKNVVLKQKELFKDKRNPVYQAKNHDISVVEFFDYRCGYCKKAQSTLEKLIEQDDKIKVIFKELPILGPSSVELAKIAIAVNIVDPNKYLEFHNTLMKSNAKNTNEAIEIALKLGLNEDKLRQTLKNKNGAIEKQIQDNQALATSIGINGTPAFVIGEELIPGAVSLDALQEIISKQRKNK